MISKEQTTRIEAIKYETERDAVVLKFFARALYEATENVKYEDLESCKTGAPLLYEKIQKMTMVTDGLCVALDHLSDRLFNIANETATLWIELVKMTEINIPQA